jgi:hypothetical protein
MPHCCILVATPTPRTASEIQVVATLILRPNFFYTVTPPCTIPRLRLESL